LPYFLVNNLGAGNIQSERIIIRLAFLADIPYTVTIKSC
jgi:hypothetical protein